MMAGGTCEDNGRCVWKRKGKGGYQRCRQVHVRKTSGHVHIAVRSTSMDGSVYIYKVPCLSHFTIMMIHTHILESGGWESPEPCPNQEGGRRRRRKKKTRRKRAKGGNRTLPSSSARLELSYGPV